jgi:FdhD protein
MNIASKEITRVFPDEKTEKQEILLLKEHRLLIKVNGQNWCSLVCTESNLMELVAGHLLSSGLLEKKDDIKEIRFCETKQKAEVFLQHDIFWKQTEKSEASCCPKNEHFFQTDGTVPLMPLASSAFKPEWIFNLAKCFSKESAIHKYTAGTHSCILAREGEPLFIAEDIGRHTALDKALGYMLLNDIPPETVMLYTSGRVPVDMVEKVIRARVCILISKSVPTAESIELAREYGLKLIFRAWPDSYDELSC